MPKGRKKGKKSGKSGNSVDKSIINSAKATGSTTNIVASDLTLRKQNFNIVQSPPKNIGNQIFWCKLSFDTVINISSLVVTEFNFLYIASSFNGFSGAAAFFDQYCIYMVINTLTSNATAIQGIRIMTAIDYDNVANIGISGIQAFSSYNESVLGSNGTDSLIRSLKPCIAPQVTSSSLPVPGGVSRAWLDIAYPNVSHYGLRLVLPLQSFTQVGAVTNTVTAVFGFRNNQ
jgi:hypothetical protein